MRAWQRKPLIPAQGETILWHVLEYLQRPETERQWEFDSHSYTKGFSGMVVAANARIAIRDLIDTVQL